MFELNIFLKSGQTVKIKCKDWKFTKDMEGNFTAYKFSGLKEPEQVGFDLKQVVGYTSNSLK